MTRQSSAGVSPDLFDPRPQRVDQRVGQREEDLSDLAASDAAEHDSPPRPAERAQNRIFHHAIEATFIAAIFLAVAGFGGTEPVSWAISQDLIFLLAAALLLHRPELNADRKESPDRTGCTGKNLPALLILASLVIWVVAQWLGSRYGVIGVDSYAIKARGLAFAAGIAGFFVALEISRHRAARKRLALSLIGLALFESLYGLAEYPGGWQYIWTYHRIYYTGSATGTYINHNHFAGLLEMILPLCLALALYHWRRASHHSRQRSFRDFLDRLGHPEILKSLVLLLVAVLLFVAIVFSLSRMGLVSALFSLAVLAALASVGRRFGRVNWKLLAACLAIGAAITVWIGAGPVVDHFARLSHDEPLAAETSEGRVAEWKSVAKLIRLHPWTGVGLGCFEFAFTRVQSTQLTLIADHAHNDYLELAAELGIPAAGVFFSLVFFVVVRAARAALRAQSSLTRSNFSPSNLERALTIGAVAAASALLVHSAADFNFYIPANALVFAVLLGMAYSHCLIDGHYEVSVGREV
jgi:O-antigen ligase